MRKRRVALGALVAVGLLAGGAYALGVVGAPSVSGVENRFAGVNDTTTLIGTNITVANPNPVGVDAGGVAINYTVDLGGVRMASGGLRGISIGSGNETISLLTAMDNDRIPLWWVSHIRNGERSTLEVHVDARSSMLGQGVSMTPVRRPITTDVLSGFNSTETRPVNADRPLVEDPVLYINETAGWWGSVSEAETPMEMRFTLYNPKMVSYTVTGIGYDITMNDVAMGEGEIDRTYVLESRSATDIEATTVLRNDRLDDWWVSHLENDQVTDLRIDFYVTLELPTGETIRVPLREMAHTETIETDMFGTKNATDEPGSTQESTDGPTATGDGETSAVPDDTDDPAVTDSPVDVTAPDGADTTETSTADDSGGEDAPTDSGGTDSPTETDDGGLL